MVSPYQIGLDANDDGFVYLQQVPLPLPPKERAVLHLLLQQWPAVVLKSSFADRIWQGAMSDESLVRCIAQIRQALAPLEQIKIVAVYRQGYQLQMSIPGEIFATKALTHHRFMDAAKAAPMTAEALMHARTLMQQRTSSALQRAESLLRKIIRDDPEYVAAKVTLAECIAVQVSCAWGLRRSSIQEALDVLDAIPEASRARSGYFTEKANLLDCAWDFAQARISHDLALSAGQCDPATHYHFGIHLLALGESQAAIDQLTNACRLAPYSPALAVTLSRALTFLDQNDTALVVVRNNYRDHPESEIAYVHMLAMEALVDPRREIARQLLALEARELKWGFAHSSLVYGLARCGEFAAAQRILDLHANANPSKKATFTSGLLLLGRADEAIRCWAKAAELGCGFLPISLRAPENRGLSRHPGYQDVFDLVFSRV